MSRKYSLPTVFLVVYFFGICSTAPQDGASKTVEYLNEADENGYHFKFYTDYGISRDETGQIVNIGNEGTIVVQGSYSYTGTDGKLYEVTYVADENGYRAKSQDRNVPYASSEKKIEPEAKHSPGRRPISLAALAGGGLG